MTQSPGISVLGPFLFELEIEMPTGSGTSRLAGGCSFSAFCVIELPLPHVRLAVVSLQADRPGISRPRTLAPADRLDR